MSNFTKNREHRDIAYIFDLDGTLANTADDISDSINLVLLKYGKVTQEESVFREYIGAGVEKCLEDLFANDSGNSNMNDTSMKIILDDFNTIYQERILNRSKPFEGVIDMLTHLNDKQTPIGILSNKQHKYVKEIVDSLFSNIRFKHVMGIDNAGLSKPMPSFTEKIVNLMNVNAEDCFYVGDTVTDIRTANNAGMFPIGVSWGYGDVKAMTKEGAKLVINKPSELIY